MKTKPQTVTAWVVAYRVNPGCTMDSIAPGLRWVSAYETRREAVAGRRSWQEGEGVWTSPVVRVALPFPQEARAK